MRILNTHDQLTAAGGGVAIIPNYGGSRSTYQNGWAIYRVNAAGQQLITDRSAHWSDFGKKVFCGGDKKELLEIAKQWVFTQGWYGGNWTRNRVRDYVPEEINKKFPLPKRETK